MAVFSDKNLLDPWGKAWRKALSPFLEHEFPDLFADEVGSHGAVPHPVLFMLPRKYRAILRAASQSTRIQALVLRAKLFVALATGPARALWETVPRGREGHVPLVVGLWIERSPMSQTPHPEFGDQIAPYTRNGEWDWQTFEDEMLNPPGVAAIRGFLGGAPSRWMAVWRAEKPPGCHRRFVVVENELRTMDLQTEGEEVVVGASRPCSETDVLRELQLGATDRGSWGSVFLADERSHSLADFEREASIIAEIVGGLRAVRPFYVRSVQAQYRP